MTLKSIFRLLAALSVLFVTAPVGFAQDSRALVDPVAQDAGAELAALNEYRLGTGDKLRVRVFGEETLGGEFSVASNGTVSLPLIGEVKLLGLTANQAQQRIEDELKKGYLKAPKVNVEILNYRPFYILGEVKKPGEYPYTNGLTVVNAVARAEGFTYRADKKKVFIKRANELDEKSYPLTTTTVVYPGDTIRITERFF